MVDGDFAEDALKLYCVSLTGLLKPGDIGLGPYHGHSYVVAKDTHHAYLIVRKYLDEKGIGKPEDRKMCNVRLIAESKEFSGCRSILFLEDAELK